MNLLCYNCSNKVREKALISRLANINNNHYTYNTTGPLRSVPTTHTHTHTHTHHCEVRIRQEIFWKQKCFFKILLYSPHITYLCGNFISINSPIYLTNIYRSPAIYQGYSKH
jgi:hypothetical protein